MNKKMSICNLLPVNNKSIFLKIFVCILCLSASLQGQDPGMKLKSRSIDFGKIAAVEYPPRIIEFTNTSTKKLAVLVVEKSDDVKVNYEFKFYAPGEQGIITVYYEPRNTGIFNEEIRLFTNLSDLPEVVTLKGEVVSVIECFPDPANLLLRNIEVIDKLTKAPVPRAEIQLVHNHNESKVVTITVNDQGKAVVELPIGLYNTKTTAVNYSDLAKEFFLPKSQPYIIFEMTTTTRAPVPRIIESIDNTPREVQPVTRIPEDIPAKTVFSYELPEDKYAANNIVLLLDVSSSMKTNHKFTLLQQSINNLVLILRPIDYVTLITYSGDSKVILNPVPGNEKEMISGAVQELVPYGITRGVKGLNTAYELALKNFIDGGNNQIIMATDGEFSEKNLNDEYYRNFITDYSQKGIRLSVMGFGINKEAIDRMKIMTDAGQGSFILVKSEDFIKDILIDEIKTKSFMGE